MTTYLTTYWDESIQRGIETMRAVEALLVAAKYIETYCPDSEITYNESVRGGYRVADDCRSAAQMISKCEFDLVETSKGWKLVLS